MRAKLLKLSSGTIGTMPIGAQEPSHWYVYKNPNRLGDQSARPCVVSIGNSIIKNIIPKKRTGIFFSK
jgi:hypothetical protein